MPNRDKTGPSGKGSRTGRGLGDCPPKKTWKERVLEEEHKTIIMEGPGKTNCWWRKKKK